MKLTPRIEHAIRKASILHDGQYRKGIGHLPYITHLYSVSLIVSEYTSQEDTVIAALLHDTIEDTSYTVEELEKDFGSNVKDLVLFVSEDKRVGGEKISWRSLKEGYIENLKSAPEEALLISAADKLHNLRSNIVGHKRVGEEYWKRFHEKKEDYLWFYGEVVSILKNRLESPIVSELEKEYAQAVEIFV
jgi:(p)ppGpp synthase/HD superfamily hydrolase|tara:strand:+ start:46262 stop:46831 length:570 start_codon:yes stop_codon:yes gene_type:complete